MVPETVALGHRGGAGAPGAVGSGLSRVAASSGSQDGETCQAPSPWGQSLGVGGGVSREGVSSSPPPSPPPPPPPPPLLVAPLPGAPGASVRSAAWLKPTVTPPPTPPQGRVGGKGRRRRRGGRRSPGAASPTPFSPHDWAPPLPRTTETWEDRAGKRSGPWLSRQGPAPPISAPEARRPASSRLFTSCPGPLEPGLGGGAKTAVGGVAGTWVRLEGGGGWWVLPVSGRGGRGGARAAVGAFGGGGSGACALAVGSSVSVLARPAGLWGYPGCPGLRLGAAAASAESARGRGPSREYGGRAGLRKVGAVAGVGLRGREGRPRGLAAGLKPIGRGR